MRKYISTHFLKCNSWSHSAIKAMKNPNKSLAENVFSIKR